MVKIFIDPGHGGNDPGASGFGLKEKDLTLKISLKIKSILETEYQGVTIKMSRDMDTTLSLKQRTDMANTWKADFLLSVHINATPSGYGYEDFVYDKTTRKLSFDAQDAINSEVIKATSWRNRGKKKKNLHMVRESHMAALLSESGFIDNPNDAQLLKDDAFLDKVARGHVNGLAKVFDLKKKVISPPKEVAVMPENRPVSATHATAWKWATDKGLMNGERPGDPLTREQFATVLKRYDEMNKK